jgi:hypothetical protein
VGTCLAEHVLFGAAIWLATGAGLLISADFVPLSGDVVLLMAAVWGTGLLLERYQRLNERSGLGFVKSCRGTRRRVIPEAAARGCPGSTNTGIC